MVQNQNAEGGDYARIQQAGGNIVNIYCQGNIVDGVVNWSNLIKSQQDIICEYNSMEVYQNIVNINSKSTNNYNNITLIGGIFLYELYEDISLLTNFILDLIRQQKTVYFLSQKYNENLNNIIETIVRQHISPIENDTNIKMLTNVFLEIIREIERCIAEIETQIKTDSPLQINNYNNIQSESVMLCNHHGVLCDRINTSHFNYNSNAFSYAINLINVVKKQFSMHPEAVSIYVYRNGYHDTLYKVCQNSTHHFCFTNCSIELDTLITFVENNIRANS